MKVVFNSDEAVVNELKKALEKKGGYCPCKLQQIPENKCMCKEFRDQIKDESFEGYCHCGLYYKYK